MIKERLQHSIRLAKDVIGLREPSVRNLALDFGLLAGHFDYVKFIILGRSRTGSNFLRGLLNSHSEVTVLGEIFQRPEAIEWGISNYPRSKRVLSLYQTDPVKFLETDVFRKVPRQTKALGFKLFYYHAQSDPWKSVWAYLKDKQDLRVLHIKRRNSLRTHLSRARAAQSDQWVNLSGPQEEETPIQLNYEDCHNDFVRTRQWEIDFDIFFQDHPKHEVIYEELANDCQKEMKQIQTFLGLDEELVAPQTRRQSHRPLSKVIANYYELKKMFKGTPWEELFED